jgi:hypothetical protein
MPSAGARPQAGETPALPRLRQCGSPVPPGLAVDDLGDLLHIGRGVGAGLAALFFVGRLEAILRDAPYRLLQSIYMGHTLRSVTSWVLLCQSLQTLAPLGPWPFVCIRG